MIKTRLFKNTFIVLAAVGVLNFIATYLYLYWTIWWFDMLVHFLAGICVGMTSVLLYYFYSDRPLPSIRSSMQVALVFILIIGVAWELYELYIGTASLADGLDYYLDTGSDLLMDISGSLIGALYAHRTLIKSN